jgi:tRNA(Ile2) C34 agmatinyltransferase TiaS
MLEVLSIWLLYGPRTFVVANLGSRNAELLVIGEVQMQFIRCNAVKSGEDVISGILNCVCPECGGRMGERGKEFRCQGECLTDWRQAWEQASAELRPRSKRTVRQI